MAEPSFTSCPVCGSHQVLALDRYPVEREIVRGARELTLLGCPDCGVLHSHPLPSDEELEAFYLRDPSAPAVAVELTPEQIERHLPKWTEIHRQQYLLLAPHLPRTPQPASNDRPRALDFGCGIGAWLDALAEQGWETYGVEPGPAASVAGCRHRILDEVLEDSQFHLVIIHHVLEHLRDPVGTLTRLRQAMNDTSGLFVSVPDFGRLHEYRVDSYARSEAHIFSYTAAGLTSVLRAGGFSVVRSFTEHEWDQVDPDWRGMRLRCLAMKSETRDGRYEDPIGEALYTLERYRKDSTWRKPV